MSALVEDQTVADLAREQLAQIAPQELPLFRATSEAYFRDPEKILDAQRQKDEKLGFGVEIIGATFLTPIVISVTQSVLEFIADEVKKQLKTQSSNLISEFVRKLFKQFRPVEEQRDTPAPLTLDQVQRVRDLALEKGRQLRLSEDQARLLADSLSGSLVTTTE